MSGVFGFRDADKIPLACRAIDGEVGVTISADSMTEFHKNLSYARPEEFRLDVSGVETLQIVVDKGKNGPDCDWFLLKDVVIE